MIKSKFALTVACIVGIQWISWAQTQQIWMVKKGSIQFFSKTPVEDIDAMSSKPEGVLNTQTGQILIRMAHSSFEFKKKLMQEHFNENYMESEKYPNAVFKGKVNENIDGLADGTYPVSADGTLEMHGVSKPRKLTGVLIVTQGSMELQSSFEVPLADHKIEIPKLLFTKIAEKVMVQSKLFFFPK